MLEIKPAQPRQSDIKHKTTGSIRGPFSQEVLCGRERLSSQPDGSQHALDCVAHRGIIIDYKNRGLIFSHRRSPGSWAEWIGRSVSGRTSSSSTPNAVASKYVMTSCHPQSAE